MLGASLLWNPPWPTRIVGRGPVAPDGRQCRPGTQRPSTVRSNRRRTTPSSVVSSMMSITGAPFSAVQGPTAGLLGLVAGQGQALVAVGVLDRFRRGVEMHHRAPFEV